MYQRFKIARRVTMENLNFLISQFEEEFNEKVLEEGEKLRQNFIEKFPLEEIKSLPLERYPLGLDNEYETLSWWLEYNSIILGSIKGGSASKHKIYYSRKNDEWVYPDKYTDVNEAWEKLKQELYDFLITVKNNNYQDVNNYEIINTMHAVRSKLLYMYFPERIIPIYNLDHIKKVLRYFDYKSNIDELDITQANIELKKSMDSSDDFNDWNNLKFMKFIYKKIIHESKYYKIAPGDNAKYWDNCLVNKYIRIGWDEIGDLKNFADYDEFLHQFHEVATKNYGYNKSKATEKANEIWTFYNLKLAILYWQIKVQAR